MGDICSIHLHTVIPVSRHQHLSVLGCLMQRVGKKYMFFPKITVVNHGSRSPSSTSAAINLLESWGFEYQTLLTFTAKSGCVWNSCESLEHGACRIGSRFCCWVKTTLRLFQFYQIYGTQLSWFLGSRNSTKLRHLTFTFHTESYEMIQHELSLDNGQTRCLKGFHLLRDM